MIKVKLLNLINNDVTGYSLMSFELSRELIHHILVMLVFFQSLLSLKLAKQRLRGVIKISFLVLCANQRRHRVVSKMFVNKKG